ncbi:MAG: hypothetical protein K2Q23_11155 [Bryobacteraceae bacterium]|nr:hypothetical protein [Bryobacteraceae bacterium]
MTYAIRSLAILFSVSVLPGQSKLDWSAIDLIEMQVRLDRAPYMPGEAFRLMLTIHNPTNRPISIPAPLRAEHGQFVAYRDDPTLPLHRQRLGIEPDRLDGPVEPEYGEIVRLAPGANLVFEVSGTDLGRRNLGIGSGLLAAVPCQPGRYGISYRYGLRGKVADTKFEVRPAELGDHQRLVLAPVTYPSRNGEQEVAKPFG